MNPNNIQTHITTPDGVHVCLEPFKFQRIGAMRNKTFTVELPIWYGDSLVITTQIARVPLDKGTVTGSADQDTAGAQAARQKGIMEARRARETFEASQANGFQVEPLASLDAYDAAIERLNAEEAPELDMQHAAPIVAEARKGSENYTTPVDGAKTAYTSELKPMMPAIVDPAGMSRKKKKK